MPAVAVSDCPPANQLRRFSEGRVSPRDCDRIALHLTACEQCLRTLEAQQALPDPIALRLKSLSFPAESEEARSVAAMLARVHAQLAQADRPVEAPAAPIAIKPRRAPATATDAESQLPASFGRYRLLKRLGTGGMGSVYLATDSQLHRDVALKIPRLTGPDALEARERFFREARAAATITHPHVCPIYDVGEIDGTPFLTMQHISGASLSERLKAGWRPTVTQAVQLVHKIAHALQIAHEHGVVHRDVKPGNILVDQRGRPILTDFGLARCVRDGNVELTRPGVLLGSPVYMSPEQARGDQGAIGPASDVYSLGIVLFELLTGKPPLHGTVLEVLSKIQHDPIPAPSTVRPEVDATVDQICRQATARQLVDRYSTMAEFAQELAKWLTKSRSRPGAGSIATSAAEESPWRLRSRGLIATAGIGLTVLAGVVISFITAKGTVEIHLHNPQARLKVLRGEETLLEVRADEQPQTHHLPHGDYRVEVLDANQPMEVKPRQFQLRPGKTVVIETVVVQAVEQAVAAAAAPTVEPPASTPVVKDTPVVADHPATTASQPAPSPATNVAVAQVPFLIPIHGLSSQTDLLPLRAVDEWRQPGIFADLRASGALEYPELDATNYVFETELELISRGNFLHYELGDGRLRVLILLEWDPSKSAYRCRLQRRHGKGSWFLHWKHFAPGQRLNLRLIRWQGAAWLHEGTQRILEIDSEPAKPKLKITFGGDAPRQGTLFRCDFRPLTADEQTAAETDLRRIRVAVPTGESTIP